MSESELSDELEKLRRGDLLRRLSVLDRGGSGCTVELGGRTLVNFAGNDYLGLSVHPEVIKASREALEHYGLGAGASRLMSGTFRVHRRLENDLAGFFGTESALVFSSGYLANLAVLGSLAEESDVLLLDRRCHASLIDAARLSRARFRVFAHNDVDASAKLLARYADARRRFIVTESVFSMDGDRAPLRELTDLAAGTNAWLVLDDAHAIGVFGKTGAGMTEQLGIDWRKRLIIVGTLSKALGALGGFVAASKVLCDWLINRARSFIYTTGLPPMVAAGARKALELTRNGTELRRRLFENVEYLHGALDRLGLDLGDSASQIIPVIVGSSGRALELSQKLLANGLYVPAVRPPTVAKGTARLRISVTALHEREHLDRLIAVLGENAGT